jgi:transcriptional regulator with XRE-family HTH domain
MTDVASQIDLNLPHRLREDPGYRRRFFWAESSAKIAAALIALRKRRGLNQKQVAEITGTKQPAISRAEQADYQNWNLNTLRSIADALDARVRVLIEPSEDVLKEYDTETVAADHQAESEGDHTAGAVNQGTGAGLLVSGNQTTIPNQLFWPTVPSYAANFTITLPVAYPDMCVNANWTVQPTAVGSPNSWTLQSITQAPTNLILVAGKYDTVGDIHGAFSSGTIAAAPLGTVQPGSAGNTTVSASNGYRVPL